MANPTAPSQNEIPLNPIISRSSRMENPLSIRKTQPWWWGFLVEIAIAVVHSVLFWCFYMVTEEKDLLPLRKWAILGSFLVFGRLVWRMLLHGVHLLLFMDSGNPKMEFFFGELRSAMANCLCCGSTVLLCPKNPISDPKDFIWRLEDSLGEESMIKQLLLLVEDGRRGRGRKVQIVRQDFRSSRMELKLRMIGHELFVSEAEVERKAKEIHAHVISLHDIEFHFHDNITRTPKVLRLEECKGITTEGDFVQWMVKAFKRRRALNLTIEDMRAMLKKFHYYLSLLSMVIIFNMALLHLLPFAGFTTFVIALFVLVVATQVRVFIIFFYHKLVRAYQGLEFMMDVHPYNVGDRCLIDGFEGEVVVEQLKALSTIFRRIDGELIEESNKVIQSKGIRNNDRVI